ncbi:MAG: peptidoglycan-associated lipoprotein Pal [Arenicella sp.]
MLRKIMMVVMVGGMLVAAGCSSTKKEQVSGSVSDQDTSNTAAVSDNPWGDDNNAWGTGYSIDQLRALGFDRNPLEYDTVYFEYNSSNIDERSQIIVAAHARNLAENAGNNVVLEGHADERGTREYNLALGERRSQSVMESMQATGYGSNTVQVVSYGEERPVSLEHNDESWQANRRVQILY